MNNKVVRLQGNMEAADVRLGKCCRKIWVSITMTKS